jgi:hypothetical protein
LICTNKGALRREQKIRVMACVILTTALSRNLKLTKNAISIKFVRTHTKTIVFMALLTPVGMAPFEEIRKMYVYLALLIDYSFARAFHKVSSR